MAAFSFRDGSQTGTAKKRLGGLHPEWRLPNSDAVNRVKAKRTLEGMRTAITAGKWTHRPPLGYLRSPQSSPSIVPDPVRAPFIRLAFKLLAKGIHTQTEVLKIVTAAGFRSERGKPLSTQSFNNVLRNPLYAGRIKVKNLGENPHGDFEPIIPQNLFDDAQAILAGKKPILQPRRRNHPDFPLRVFVRCGNCGLPLTGSWSTGRGGKKYGHYCCRNPKCRAVKMRKNDFEAEFVEYLRTLRPRAEIVRLFRAIVLDVWHEKQAANLANAGAIKQRVEDLERRIDRLDEAFIYEKSIDPKTYERQKDKLQQELLIAEMERRKTETEGYDIETVLSFAEHLISNAAELWLKSDLSQRQRLQQAFFPKGLEYQDGNWLFIKDWGHGAIKPPCPR